MDKVWAFVRNYGWGQMKNMGSRGGDKSGGSGGGDKSGGSGGGDKNGGSGGGDKSGGSWNWTVVGGRQWMPPQTNHTKVRYDTPSPTTVPITLSIILSRFVILKSMIMIHPLVSLPPPLFFLSFALPLNILYAPHCLLSSSSSLSYSLHHSQKLLIEHCITLQLGGNWCSYHSDWALFDCVMKEKDPGMVHGSWFIA